MTKTNAPTKDQLAQWDAEDALNWTRAEFEIPSAKACGGQGGECARSEERAASSDQAAAIVSCNFNCNYLLSMYQPEQPQQLTPQTATQSTSAATRSASSRSARASTSSRSWIRGVRGESWVNCGEGEEAGSVMLSGDTFERIGDEIAAWSAGTAVNVDRPHATW
jgi:hypothetical protein